MKGEIRFILCELLGQCGVMKFMVFFSGPPCIVAAAGYMCLSDLLYVSLYVCLCSGWFGLRKEFCPWVLDTCPVLQEYGNISYKVHDATSTRGPRQAMRDLDPAVAAPTSDQSAAGREPLSSSHKRGHSGSRSKRHGKSSASDELPKFVLPVVSIDMPD